MAAAAQQYREASYLYQPRGQSSTDTGPPAMAAPESTDAVMTDVQQEQQVSDYCPAEDPEPNDERTPAVLKRRTRLGGSKCPAINSTEPTQDPDACSDDQYSSGSCTGGSSGSTAPAGRARRTVQKVS